MRIAYLDCFSGASGNMLLGAFIDAGVPEEALLKAVEQIGLAGFKLDARQIRENSLQATRVTIQLPDNEPHRNFSDISNLITSSSLPEQVQEKSIAIFRRLAEAEAKVHGCSIEQVHFHEVGAVDAIIDIVGTVTCYDELGIQKLICSALPLSHGWVKCAHGDLPLPAPAVCNLLKGVPVYGEDIKQELVTPTGAAIIKELADDFGPVPPMRLQKSGYGAGTLQREDNRPNLLRLIVGEEYKPEETQRVVVIETSLDDWSTETWPHILNKLLANKALDVILTPVHMKKGRPGFTLKVICDPAHANNIEQIIFEETSAIGLRFHAEERTTLPREIITVTTPWGPIKAKKIETATGSTITPEYEACRKLAEKNDIAIKKIYEAVNKSTSTGN